MTLRTAFISILTAGAFAITATTPAAATLPLAKPDIPESSNPAPTLVRDHFRNNGNVIIYRNGHRGYRHYRHGHVRYYDGYWYPRSAFGLSIIIAPQPRRVIRSYGGNAHVNWCYARYRSYRAHNNTYQPYGGPRRICVSPYY